MSTSIVSIGGKLFQGFLSQLTSGLTKPNAKFLRHFLCGVLFSDNLVLTEVAAKVPLLEPTDRYGQAISQAVSQRLPVAGQAPLDSWADG